jgi:hypothetical protein
MKKSTIMIFVFFVLACVLGVFGQGIAYFLNDIVDQIHPIAYLTINTCASILLFILACILLYIQSKKGFIRIERFHAFLSLFLVVGISISSWSLFVLIMWWG